MIRPTIFIQFLLAALLIGLAPLAGVSVYLLSGLEDVREQLAVEIGDSAEQQASESLEMRARQVADTIADFLVDRESDLLFLTRFAYDRQILQQYYESHRGEVWEQVGPAGAQKELKAWIPLYRSIAVIGADGQELIVLKNGAFLPKRELRNVSRPAETEFGNETYFDEIRQLKRGQIYVSHLTGHHVDIAEQASGKRYNGVIRFGTPLVTRNGRFNGMLVISLDHRHLMEFSQHIDPGPRFITASPTYESANYAFLFDDEGWIITHPKLWDIRGSDKQGRPVPAYTARSTPEHIQKGLIPFNLFEAGFIHPNYPVVAEQVRTHKSGSADVTNVGGKRKIMAYAPIRYSTGAYRKHGIFGGVTIGYQTAQFQQQAHTGSLLLKKKLQDFLTRSLFVLGVTALLAALAAWMLARGITTPLKRLHAGVQRLTEGEDGTRVPVTGNDELSDLAMAFNTMAAELELRKNRLITILDELQVSRQEILDERNFKESILESISSAIVTFAPDGALTSRNSTADRFLGRCWPLASHYSAVFEQWGDLAERITNAFATKSGFGRRPLQISQQSAIRHFDTGIFPIGSNAELGLTVTLRDETIREQLREETLRLDRLASLGKLAAGIAHEIRNPLTGISLLLDDLHDRAQLSQPERELLRKALGEIERMERLITSLLTFAAPRRANLQAGDLRRIVADLALLARRPCEKQGITLSVLMPEQLPTCRFDAEKLQQALLNLLKNAQEAMPDGGALVIEVTTSNGWNLISIQDSGPGIASTDHGLIFEPFFTSKGAGTGLGLSITRRIIEEHGGRIDVESAPGQGATFIIRLPFTG